MAPVLGAPNAASLIEKMLGLENVKSLLAIRPLLQRA